MSDIPDDLNRAVTRDLHDQGVEMTPDEVSAHRRDAYHSIRRKLRALGFDPPEGDYELLQWMKGVVE